MSALHLGIVGEQDVRAEVEHVVSTTTERAWPTRFEAPFRTSQSPSPPRAIVYAAVCPAKPRPEHDRRGAQSCRRILDSAVDATVASYGWRPWPSAEVHWNNAARSHTASALPQIVMSNASTVDPTPTLDRDRELQLLAVL
jgi:hypothetical protein